MPFYKEKIKRFTKWEIIDDVMMVQLFFWKAGQSKRDDWLFLQLMAHSTMRAMEGYCIVTQTNYSIVLYDML